MSLWGVGVVMGSPLEPLGRSFWDRLGVIFGALGVSLEASGGHFWGLWVSLGDFLVGLGPEKSYMPPRL